MMRSSRLWLAAVAALSVLAACAGAPAVMQSRADTDNALAALEAEGFTTAPVGDPLPTDRETARDLAEARRRLSREMPLDALDDAPLTPITTKGSKKSNIVCKHTKKSHGKVRAHCWQRGKSSKNAIHVSANARTGVSSISRTIATKKSRGSGGGIALSNYAAGAAFDESMRPNAKQKFTIYFDVGSSSVTPEALDTLRDAAALVKQGDISLIRIEGHTDLSGSEKANLVLSLKRSKTADQSLIDVIEGKAPPRSLQGYGPRKPAVKGNAGLNSIKNRRVEVILF